MSEYCDHQLRVRYAETDQMGVAYYAGYLVWFEVGRAEYCRFRGFSYRDLERSADRYLMVVEAHCRYRVPLRYDDVFVVRTRLAEFRSRTLTFSYELLDPAGGRRYADGSTRHVVAGPDGRLHTFPAEYAGLLASG